MVSPGQTRDNWIKAITPWIQIAAVIWAAASLSAKVTHLDESVHILNASMIKVFEEMNQVQIEQAVQRIEIQNLKQQKP